MRRFLLSNRNGLQKISVSRCRGKVRESGVCEQFSLKKQIRMSFLSYLFRILNMRTIKKPLKSESF